MMYSPVKTPLSILSRYRPVTLRDLVAEEAASDAEQAALDALFETQPTTMKGLRALVSYVVESKCGVWSEDIPPFRCLEVLLNSPLLAA
jgi:hypothetical protein